MKTLKASLQDLAARQPDTRIYLVPLLRKHAADSEDPTKTLDGLSSNLEGYVADLQEIITVLKGGTEKTAMQFTEKEWKAYSERHPKAERRNHQIKNKTKPSRQERKELKGKELKRIKELRVKYKTVNKIFDAQTKEISKFQKSFEKKSEEWKKENAPAIQKAVTRYGKAQKILFKTVKELNNLEGKHPPMEMDLILPMVTSLVGVGVAGISRVIPYLLGEVVGLFAGVLATPKSRKSLVKIRDTYNTTGSELKIFVKQLGDRDTGGHLTEALNKFEAIPKET